MISSTRVKQLRGDCMRVLTTTTWRDKLRPGQAGGKQEGKRMTAG